MGPDGYLYVLTFGKEDGTIYRILPAENSQQEIVSEEDYRWLALSKIIHISMW